MGSRSRTVSWKTVMLEVSAKGREDQRHKQIGKDYSRQKEQYVQRVLSRGKSWGKRRRQGKLERPVWLQCRQQG